MTNARGCPPFVSSKTRSIRDWILMVVWLLGVVSVDAQDAVSVHADRHAAAIERARAGLREDVPDGLASRLVTLADAHLRAGDAPTAITHYERAVALQPPLRPYLWQYGIALFFDERFQDGRDLFVDHRRVNAADVENAAWHFLCEAKANGIQTARRELLPAPGDRRVPMSQIFQRLSGGDDAAAQSTAIDAAVDSAAAAEKSSARFYADLYLGLIADAEGDSTAAKKYLDRAADDPWTHFMADVARLYASSLRRESD